MRYGIVMASLCLAASLAQAQPQDARRDAARDAARDGRRDPMDRANRMMDRLAERLQFDETQRVEAKTIVESYRERIEELAPLRAEMRDAREQGDTARMEALRAQMEESGGPRELFRRVIEDIEPILTDEQSEQFSQMREARQQRRERGESMRRMARELPDDLEMNDEQRAAYRELLETRRNAMRERMRELRPLWREMREARDAGDEAKVEELRAKLQAQRPDAESMRKALLDEVKPLLREDQVPMLQTYYADLGVILGDENAETADVRNLLRAARKASLTAQQREQWKRIAYDSLKAARQARRSDDAARARIAAEARQSIVKLLNPKQIKKFEEALQRLERRAKKRHRE